jgi:hypothetical protein
MTDSPLTDDLDEQAVTEFASRLATFAAELPARERAALNTILMRAMDPIERMRWRDAADLLSPGEEAVLNRLLEERPPA